MLFNGLIYFLDKKATISNLQNSQPVTRMPTIGIHQINPYISKTYPVKEIEYDFGDTLLKKILYDFDPKLDTSNAHVAIGNDILHSRDLAVDSCLTYGDCIHLRTDVVPIMVRLGKKEVRDNHQNTYTI